MKPIELMTEEELNDLVSYNSANGNVYYYSRIKHISGSSLFYEDDEYAINEPGLAALLQKNLTRYERYKLFTATNLDKKINEQLETFIKLKYDGVITGIIDNLNEVLAEVKTFKDTTVSSLSTVISKANTAINALDDATISTERSIKSLGASTYSVDRLYSVYISSTEESIGRLQNAIENVNLLFKGLTDVNNSTMENITETEGTI